MSNSVHLCSGAYEAYLGVGDLTLVNLFGSDQLVGQVIDVATSQLEISEIERETLTEEDGPMFLLCL